MVEVVRHSCKGHEIRCLSLLLNEAQGKKEVARDVNFTDNRCHFNLGQVEEDGEALHVSNG